MVEYKIAGCKCEYKPELSSCVSGGKMWQVSSEEKCWCQQRLPGRCKHTSNYEVLW